MSLTKTDLRVAAAKLDLLAKDNERSLSHHLGIQLKLTARQKNAFIVRYNKRKRALKIMADWLSDFQPRPLSPSKK